MIADIKQHKITVSKTAHVVTYGDINETTKEIWIVLHGYGQLPEYFIKSFTGISNSFVIAPAGLSTAYIKGFNGRVGANWMTSKNREDEITDYLNYLNEVLFYFRITNQSAIKINVLGFSQGAATASRFVNQTSIKVTRLILWGGLIPIELQNSRIFLKKKIYIVYGTEDEFILPKKELFFKQIEELKMSGVISIEYKGSHRVEQNTFNILYRKYWS